MARRSDSGAPRILHVMDAEALRAAREDLASASTIPDLTERMLEVAAIVSDAVEGLGIHPVVVGGLALATWASDTYLTADIDVLMPEHPAVRERLDLLGFVRDGREWVLDAAGIALEAPGSSLAPGETFDVVELASGRSVRVLSPEDLLLYRLHEFVGGGHAESFRHVEWLLRIPRLDPHRLEARAQQEGLQTALRRVAAVADEQAHAGIRLDTWELHAIARELRGTGLH